jgi:4-amino-4-deoxy-L-arabinose transferase-like glycosyltransferase
MLLLIIFGAELVLSARQLSQTWDEADHLLAGHRYWQCADFSFDVESPPLPKLIAAASLYWMQLRQPDPPCGSREIGDEFEDGRRFLYSNDADRLLMRARLAASLFTLTLLLLVWHATKSFFGITAAVFSAVLLVFEPNILAHGALVTTDMALTVAFFSAMVALYWYFQRPNAWRVLVVGLTMGLTFASKFAGVLVIPVIMALAGLEIIWRGNLEHEAQERRLHLRRTVVDISAALFIGVFVVWSFYAYHFAAEPRSAYVRTGERILQKSGAKAAAMPDPGRERGVFPFIFAVFRKAKLLPECYLEGLGRMIESAESGRRMFAFARTYETGRWFYFPFALIVKLTLPVMLFLSLCLFEGPFWSQHRRELLYLTIPALLFLAFSMISRVNIGIRHVLPLLPFLIVIAGAAATVWFSRLPWRILVCVILAWHVVSSMHSFPDYLSYANEAFGGPANAYNWLGDSNVDWGQSLKEVQRYIARNSVTPCWFLQNGTADASYYGIPCETALEEQYPLRITKPLPERMQGTVFISSHYLANLGWFSEYASDPLAVFKAASPVAKLGGSSILVYQGDFDTRLLAGTTLSLLAEKLGREGQPDLALQYATHARSLNPEAAYPALSLCSAYTQLQQLELAAAYCHEGQARLAAHREYNRDLLMVGSIISNQLQNAMQ